VVEVCQAYRSRTTSLVAATDRGDEMRRLVEVVRELGEAHEAFAQASNGWSDSDKAAKRRQRKRREMLFTHVRLALARLGELDRLAGLERLPFENRLEELSRFIDAPGAISARAAHA
jgi:hypothetical protein